jgi:hypothetical protein
MNGKASAGRCRTLPDAAGPGRRVHGQDAEMRQDIEQKGF